MLAGAINIVGGLTGLYVVTKTAQHVTKNIDKQTARPAKSYKRKSKSVWG